MCSPAYNNWHTVELQEKKGKHSILKAIDVFKIVELYTSYC